MESGIVRKGFEEVFRLFIFTSLLRDFSEAR